MKKLPELYKNEIINPQDHNTKVCYLKKEDEKQNIEEVLDNIFNGIGHVYNQKVFIKTKTKTLETYLVSKTKTDIITLDNEKIPIKDILFLKKE